MATYATKSNPFIEPIETARPDELVDERLLLDGLDETPEQDHIHHQSDSESNPILDAKDDLQKTGVKTDFGQTCSNASDQEDSRSTSSQTRIIDTRHNQHLELIKKLRLQLQDLERFALERGELTDTTSSITTTTTHVPLSELAERQNVVLEALKEKLQLNIGLDEIEKLEMDELKKQVDKEIQDLLDPQKTKDHLLSQLQTQLSDLERYINGLHLVMGKTSKDGSCHVTSPETLNGIMLDKIPCSCQLHGCSSSSSKTSSDVQSISGLSNDLLDNDSLPRTTRLIRSLVAQLICTDMKLKERDKPKRHSSCCDSDKTKLMNSSQSLDQSMQEPSDQINGSIEECIESHKDNNDSNQFNDMAVWTAHINKVILATDSLLNLFDLNNDSKSKKPDENVIESVVRRQLVPALKNILSYGLIEKNEEQKTSYLFDPYSLISSWICFPSLTTSQNKSTSPVTTISNDLKSEKSAPSDNKRHVWDVILDYYKTRNEPSFNSSSIKTLSQSFDLEPSVSGSIKITSKQALIIVIEDIIDTLSKSKPNGPESHFRQFVYNALNKRKLSVWIRLIFRSKSIVKRYYHNYSFVNQQDKMNKLLKIIEVLNEHEFKLKSDVESIEQFVGAF